MALEITDAHCHVGLLKYEPLESLEFHMRRSGVSRAVLVQYGGNYDNSYLEQCLNRDRQRYAAVMLVDPGDDGSTVRRLAERGFVGIRLNANSRARSADPLAHWRAAAESDITVSVRGDFQSLTSEPFLAVVREFSQMQFVIEHLGGASSQEAYPYNAFKNFLSLAQFPNVSVKVPGFGQFSAGDTPARDVPPFYDMALDAFGSDRLMWGSDYPPVSSREGYDNSLWYPLNYLSRLSISERAAIFDLNARRCWNL